MSSAVSFSRTAAAFSNSCSLIRAKAFMIEAWVFSGSKIRILSNAFRAFSHSPQCTKTRPFPEHAIFPFPESFPGTFEGFQGILISAKSIQSKTLCISEHFQPGIFFSEVQNPGFFPVLLTLYRFFCLYCCINSLFYLFESFQGFFIPLSDT